MYSRMTYVLVDQFNCFYTAGRFSRTTHLEHAHKFASIYQAIKVAETLNGVYTPCVVAPDPKPR